MLLQNIFNYLHGVICVVCGSTHRMYIYICALSVRCSKYPAGRMRRPTTKLLNLMNSWDIISETETNFRFVCTIAVLPQPTDKIKPTLKTITKSFTCIVLVLLITLNRSQLIHNTQFPFCTVSNKFRGLWKTINLNFHNRIRHKF